MKDGIHPKYQDVAFVDLQTGNKFVTRSTLTSRETIEIDGKTMPLFKCDVTSESHPFYTGAQTRLVETGRVEKFRAPLAAIFLVRTYRQAIVNTCHPNTPQPPLA
jgi:large subunit ribosomal protein L31